MCRRLIYIISLVVVLAGAARAADPDLVGHWKFDETSGGMAYDSSGNGNDGTLVGDPQWVPGKLGGALEFNGDDYVDCGNADSLQIQEAITISFWFQVEAFQNTWEAFFSKGDSAYRASRGGGNGNGTHLGISGTGAGGGSGWFNGPTIITGGDWHHFAGTFDGAEGRIYIDGVLDATSPAASGPINIETENLWIGNNSQNTNRNLHGLMDDVRLYKRALTDVEVLGVMAGGGAEYPLASGPTPPDGEYHPDTWVSMSWRAGDYAASHDVYMSENLDDVSAGAEAAFQGNRPDTMFVVGFPGFPYPDGLVPGTTYYWRIDEVNDAEPNSPWIGDIWSFTVPPKTAYNPDPADGAEFVEADTVFTWTGGFGAKLHTVYMGTDFDEVSNAEGGAPLGSNSYSPAALEPEKVYYWRVDEFDPPFTHKGDIWGFTTPGAVGNAQPANGAGDVQLNATLSWTAADNATSHELYFGADADAVGSATTASPEYIGSRALGAESYDPGGLAWDSSYAWRVDEVYAAETVKGLVWTFGTADFLLVDDFEAYNDVDPPDPNSNRIFDKWIDGFGTTTNGALVGNDMPPYAEQSIVHGGDQSMPYFYDNTSLTSEATLTLVYPRDWTAEGVTKLSLWFRGDSANAPERMYVALNGSAVVYHDDASVTQMGGWNEWVIELQAFADQGVALTSVNTIAIGFGTKGSPAAGGSGTVLIDDIRLIR
ncbi:MAG: LamG domain-containing protein [Planctomycetota bacterium]|jgi:hypothetical protein